MAFRNYLSQKFNLHSPINLKEYRAYIRCLKMAGATEIEHSGRRLSSIQKQRTKDIISIIHDEGLKAILYTGPFGKDTFEQYAQRDKNQKPLSLMCPSSEYIDKVLLPELNEVLEGYDGIYFDMPWIAKGGCYCNHCNGNNKTNVRNALIKIVGTLNIRTSVNAGAPKIHNEFPSSHIDNLNGIFDEYVTEWNPLRWNQRLSVVRKTIEYAREITHKKVYHATTCTDKRGKIYSVDLLADLFSIILIAGASPRLGISFYEKGLNKVREAMDIAYSRQSEYLH
jgi:hypothetical protein